MKPKRHVAWDFDGTIIDSFRLWKQVMIDYCRKHQLPLPDNNEIRSSFGDTGWKGFSTWKMPLKIQDERNFCKKGFWRGG